MTMNEIIEKLEQNQYDIPVQKLTTVQKYGMIEYAFLNHNHIGEIMGLLLTHVTSQNQEQKIKSYFFLTLKQTKDYYPFELLQFQNMKKLFQNEDIQKIFQILKDKIGNHLFTYDELLTIVDYTILPNYVKGKNKKKDFYYMNALQIQKQIYRQIQNEMNEQFMNHKIVLRHLQELPHQYQKYYNDIQAFQKVKK